jgi:lipopolysaccharide/colanic/teichoic acid biosynthesis glycosyltransferase
MVPNAAQLGPKVNAENDPRMTRVGAVLRRTYLDEIPQLINVLRGNMSLVGPRPEAPEYVKFYQADERRVLEVKPGMAGPATLAYSPHEAEILSQHEDPEAFYVGTLLHARVRMDLEYLDTGSMLHDAQILARTFLSVLSSIPGKRKKRKEQADAEQVVT